MTVQHPDPGRAGQRLVVQDDRVTGTLGHEGLDATVAADAGGLLTTGRSDLLTYDLDGRPCGEGIQVFVESFAPQPRLLVFGANDFAVAVAELGGYLGYRVTVCDARPVFATRTRFPKAELVVDWPHRYLQAELRAGRIDDRTAICVLTHDPKFDRPLLKLALKSCRSQATSARWAPGAPTRTGWRSSPTRASHRRISAGCP